MAEYKGIKGFQVQTRTEDPVPYAQALADNPYVGAWSSGGNLNTGRGQSMGSGSQTAAIVAGGKTPSNTANAEQYNGSSWTEVNDLNTARGGSGGTSGLAPYTATIVFGGEEPSLSAKTEYYNGSSWAEQNDLNTARSYFAGAGSAYTAALAFGGNDSNYAQTESWDGSSWTEVNDLNTGKGGIAGTGTQTAALKAGGNGSSDLVESWNGSSWTETTEINNGRTYVVGNGTQTSMVIYGGYDTAYRAFTESWNGSAWTEVSDLATARGSIGRAGAGNTSGLAAGGDLPGSPGRSALTEEWSFSGLDPSSTPAADYADAITGDFYYNSTSGQFKTVNTGGAPIGTWASGGAIPQGVSAGMGFGTQTASVIGGGNAGPDYSNNVYEYDGSSWTAGGSLTASAGQARTGHGVLTAGGAVAGYKTSGNAVIANYEQYDGTSFTEQNDLNTARQTLAAAGSTTAALAVGGTTGVGPGSTQTGLTNVESYNGSSWTETTENNTGRKQATSFSGGPAPTMIFIGGASGGTFYANTETYNGSAWTETTDLNTARSAFGGAGQAQTDGLVFGGSVPANTAVTEQWNGTTWTELSDLSTARNSLVGSGTGAVSALAAGGYSTTVETATEEFTAADFQIKTVTQS